MGSRPSPNGLPGRKSVSQCHVAELRSAANTRRRRPGRCRRSLRTSSSIRVPGRRASSSGASACSANCKRTSSWKPPTWGTAESGGPRQASIRIPIVNCLTRPDSGRTRAQPQQSGGSRLAHQLDQFSAGDCNAGFRPGLPGNAADANGRPALRPVPQWARWRSDVVSLGLPLVKRGTTRCRPRPPSASRMACRCRHRSCGPKALDLGPGRRPTIFLSLQPGHQRHLQLRDQQAAQPVGQAAGHWSFPAPTRPPSWRRTARE